MTTDVENITADEIIDMIFEGVYDDDLGDLIQSCVNRRKLLQQRQARLNKKRLKPGMRVRIVGNIRPKYMIGLEGTVSDKPGKPRFIQVDLDQSAGRFSQHVGIPADCLEAVTDA